MTKLGDGARAKETTGLDRFPLSAAKRSNSLCSYILGENAATGWVWTGGEADLEGWVADLEGGELFASIGEMCGEVAGPSDTLEPKRVVDVARGVGAATGAL
jgi:hypothetical protein